MVTRDRGAMSSGALFHLNILMREGVTISARGVIWFFDIGMKLLGPLLICVALGDECARCAETLREHTRHAMMAAGLILLVAHTYFTAIAPALVPTFSGWVRVAMWWCSCNDVCTVVGSGGACPRSACGCSATSCSTMWRACSLDR